MNTSRRQFLATAAAALAVPQIAARGRAAETPPGANRRLIDCQSHLFCPELVALMEKRQTEPVGPDRLTGRMGFFGSGRDCPVRDVMAWQSDPGAPK